MKPAINGRVSLLAAVLTTVFAVAGTGLAVAQQQAPAQQAGPRAERTYIFGAGGYNGQWDDESRLGNGLGVEGGAGYRLTDKWSVEGLASHLRHNRPLVYYTLSTDPLGQTIPTPYYSTLTGGATYILGQLRYAFSTSRVRPYVGFGAGAMRYSGDSWASVMPPADANFAAPARTVKTAAAGSLTAGVEFALGGRASFAPYVSWLMANPGETGTAIAFLTGARVSFGR